MENNKEEKKTEVTIDINIKKSTEHNEWNENEQEMVPMSKDVTENTIKLNLTAEQIKSLIKVIGEGISESITDKL